MLRTDVGQSIADSGLDKGLYIPGELGELGFHQPVTLLCYGSTIDEPWRIANELMNEAKGGGPIKLRRAEDWLIEGKSRKASMDLQKSKERKGSADLQKSAGDALLKTGDALVSVLKISSRNATPAPPLLVYLNDKTFSDSRAQSKAELKAKAKGSVAWVILSYLMQTVSPLNGA